MLGNSKSRMCNIDRQSYHPFTSRTRIGGSSAFLFIKNDPTGIHNAEPINVAIKASIESKSASIKGKKDIFIKQVGN